MSYTSVKMKLKFSFLENLTKLELSGDFEKNDQIDQN